MLYLTYLYLNLLKLFNLILSKALPSDSKCIHVSVCVTKYMYTVYYIFIDTPHFQSLWFSSDLHSW